MKSDLLRAGLIALLVAMLWQRPPTYAQDLSHDVIIIERSLGCFGACADYDIEIHADGRVIWNGRANVDARGTKRSRIDPSIVGKLVEEFFQHGTEREICMDGGGVDGPIYWVLYSRSGEAEKVRAQSIELYRLSKVSVSFWEAGGYPCTIREKFDDVITRLERAVNSHQWMHGQESILDRQKLDEDIQIGTKLGFTRLMRFSAYTEPRDVEEAVQLAQSQPANAPDQTGWTALMVAAARCNKPVIETLLAAGADPNAQDGNGDTALISAASSNCVYSYPRPERYRDINQYAVMKQLIEAGANVNHANRDGATALMIGAQFGNPESMRALLEAGAQPNLRDRRGDDVRDYTMKLAQWLRRQPQSRREEYGDRLQEILAVLAAKR